MTTRNENLRLIISGDGKLLGAELERDEKKIKTFTNKTKGFFSEIDRKASSSIKNAIRNPLTVLGGGAALLYAGNQLINFDDQVLNLAINGSLAADEQMKLREQIIQTAFAAKQLRTEVSGGVDAIVQRTGDIAFAREVIGDIGVAATGSGAAMSDMGALASNLQQKLNLVGKEIAPAFNLLVVQGKAGAFTMQDMASQGERLFSAAGRFDVKGMEGLRKFGALVQIARMGTGSSEQATTAIESMLSDIIEKQKIIKKEAKGFSIFKSGTKDLKDIDQVIKGIITGTGGDITKISKIFGSQSIRGISTLAKAYKETGGFDIYDKLVNADAGRAGELLADFDRKSQSAKFNVNQLQNQMQHFADISISPVLSDLNKFFNNISQNQDQMAGLETLFKGVGGSFTLISKGLVMAASGWGMILDLYQKAVGIIADSKPVQSFFESVWDTNASGAADRSAVSRFNALPLEERKRRIEQLEKTGKTSIKNDIKIDLQIDSSGRVVSTTNDPNTKIQIKNSRGAF